MTQVRCSKDGGAWAGLGGRGGCRQLIPGSTLEAVNPISVRRKVGALKALVGGGRLADPRPLLLSLALALPLCCCLALLGGAGGLRHAGRARCGGRITAQCRVVSLFTVHTPEAERIGSGGGRGAVGAGGGMGRALVLA